jgi:thiamine biosynthesis lipoprotein
MSGADKCLEFLTTSATAEIEEWHTLRTDRVIARRPRQSGACQNVVVTTKAWRLLSHVSASALCLVTAGACGTTATTPKADASLVERSRVSMGSAVNLSAWTTDEPVTLEAFEKVFHEFDRLDALMSVWKEGSDVLRLNAAAGKQAVAVGPDVREVLLAAQKVSEWTEGKFDVTFGALSGIWKFDHDIDGQIPERSEIASRLPLIDYRALRIDERAGTAALAHAGMKVHLGGIGKGYAIDRGVTVLREAGLTDFMIQSGGDMFVAGRRGDRPWRVGIQDPRGAPNTPFAAIEITDAAFSTSGDYERFFMRDGKRYHHILDPDIGEPAMRSRSVTIMAKSATTSDGLSTGVFILGAEKGMALIEQLDDVEGVIVTADNQVRVSSGLQGRLARLSSPTE